MVGITIAEQDHKVVITVDTEIVDRWRIDQALSLLDTEPRDFPHIPSMDPDEQSEIAASLNAMTPEERKYTLVRGR